jgi:hypothetical protein
MFSWLFGKNTKPQSHEAAGRTIPSTNSIQLSKGSAHVEIRDDGDGWLSIPAIGFFGAYMRSPNGNYRIAWHDAGPDGGEGWYILTYGDEICCQGRMERPQDGKVADTGVFILNDWRASSEFTGTFRAFKSDGSKLLMQNFAANLANNGLSADGRLAACQTCNSDDEHDSAVLTVFDLTQGKELHRFRAESGWPHTYAFSPDGQTLTLGYPNGEGEFAYKLDGTFVERDAWIAAGLKRGDLLMVRRLIDEAGGEIAQDSALGLLEAVDCGLAKGNWQDSAWQAFGFRLRGEVLESMGELGAAIESYDKALALNPKIGIKRRADQLRKVAVPAPKL